MLLNQTSSQQRITIGLLVLLAAGLAIGLYLFSTQIGALTPLQAPGNANGLAAASLAAGSESLLAQTAVHLSKLLGGESIGGFPGFEPPDDDQKYKDKIHHSSYSAEEVNHWVKEINNLLQQVVERNPNMTLEQILQKMGWQQQAVDEFTIALRNAHFTAKNFNQLGMGVMDTTLTMLEELMQVLGVVPWP